MPAVHTHSPRNTGPIELRDLGPNGRPLGTAADCQDGSTWELHRGELIRQMSSHEIHSIIMFLLGTLFRTHARDGLSVMGDVYCELVEDDGSLSLRAPDVVLGKCVKRLKDGPFQGIPILAVEIRATQSKKQLEEKVKLFIEHDWPCIWLVHADRQEVEVVTPGAASVVYPRGTDVPLVPELDLYDLKRIPVAALFDIDKFKLLNDGWVDARARVQQCVCSILTVLGARKILIADRIERRITTEQDLAKVQRWLTIAATAASAEAFERGIDEDTES
jgi:Uma2 family endonuclease